MNIPFPSPIQPLVEVERLTVAFGGTPVVEDLSFSIAPGECLAFVGESGSGKSVTARSLVGLAGAGATVEADRLTFTGRDLLTLTPREWRRLRGAEIGFVLQDALGSLDPLRRVGEEITEPLLVHGRLDRRGRRARAEELLARVGVPEPRLRAAQRPGELSGGLRQRALIASAIACGPKLLIADEPTTALDAAIQAQILDLLCELRRADTALLVISHDLGVVARLADRIAVLRHGRIVEQGPTEAILGAPGHAYTRRLVDAAGAIHGGKRPTSVIARLPANEPVIEAWRVAKAYRGPDGRSRAAVEEASLRICRGETLGLVGASGSGKTTLARILLGLEAPDRGEVRLDGRDWGRLSPAEQRRERRRMQVVFQDPLASFDPRYTVGRVLAEAIGVAERPTRERVAELLALVRLDGRLLDRRPIELSGGQRQRVAIARALAPRPELLVLDEPVSALDVSVQADILALLEDLKHRLGVAALFISHDLGVVRRLSDRIAVMDRGRIVEEGPADRVFSQPEHPYTRTLLAAIPTLEPQMRRRRA